MRGISSATATAIRKSSASPSGRPIACVATNSGKFGASAPSAVTIGADQAMVADHAPAADTVGEEGERQGDDDPGPHDGAGDAEPEVADAEVVGGELRGLGEQACW